MKLIDAVVAASSFGPEVGLKSRMLEPLKKLGLGISMERYMGGALLLSLVFGILTCVLALLIGETIALGLFGFAFIFGFLLYLPTMEIRRRTSEFEARLPFVLRTISMLLEMRLPFQRALEIVAKTEPELRLVVDDISKGITVQKSFARLTTFYDSFTVKRALSQLLTAYEVGSSGNEVGRIGDEMLSIQRHSLKEHSSRSAMFGLIFVVCAAVLPTFFLVYSVLGQMTNGQAADRISITIAMLVVFPLISLMILLVAKSLLPRSAIESGSGSADISVMVPAGAIILALLILPDSLTIFAVLAGLAAIILLVYRRYQEEKRVEELERHLPDALFSAAGLPKSTKMEDLFCMIEKAGYGTLSEEAAKSRKQLAVNLSTDMVLEDLASRNKSQMLVRACDMLGHVFSTNSFDRLNRLAEDITKFVEIRREKADILSMQKYTMVLGGFIVPLILKITLNLLTSMAEFFTTEAGPQLQFVYSIIPAYIVIYGLLSYFYISSMEENRSGPAAYFLGIVLSGMITFFFINI
jgi:Flp pilus assembly protein TadB